MTGVEPPQGHTKAAPTGLDSCLVRVGTLARDAAADRLSNIRRRLLAGVDRGSHVATPREGTFPRWERVEGAARWGDVRQHVGGDVDGPTFRAALDGLLADGTLVEAWTLATGALPLRHWIARPGSMATLGAPIQLRGRCDVLQSHPAFASLAADGVTAE